MEQVASVIAVIQISEKLVTICTLYELAVKDAKEDIERLQAELKALCNVLKTLEESIGSDTVLVLSATNMITGTLQECSSDLEDLEERLKPRKLQKLMKKFGKRALQWPFSTKNVDKVVARLERHKLTINLTLNIVSDFKTV